MCEFAFSCAINLSRKPKSKSPIFIFNHIPRTAGGALIAALAADMKVVNDYLPKASAELPHWLDTPVCLDKLPPNTVVSGHYTVRPGFLYERYPQVLDTERFKLITFLRRPRYWCASHIRYFGLETTRRATQEAKEAGGMFSRVLKAPSNVPCQALQNYWFVGLSENVQSDADRLLTLLGRAPRRLAPTNRTFDRPLTDIERQLVCNYEGSAVCDHLLYRMATVRNYLD